MKVKERHRVSGVECMDELSGAVAVSIPCASVVFNDLVLGFGDVDVTVRHVILNRCHHLPDSARKWSAVSSAPVSLHVRVEKGARRVGWVKVVNAGTVMKC